MTIEKPTMNEDVPPIQDLGDFPASHVSFPGYTQYHHSSKESPFPKLPFLVSMLNLRGGKGGRPQKTAWRVFIEKNPKKKQKTYCVPCRVSDRQCGYVIYTKLADPSDSQ